MVRVQFKVLSFIFFFFFQNKDKYDTFLDIEERHGQINTFNQWLKWFKLNVGMDIHFYTFLILL